MVNEEVGNLEFLAAKTTSLTKILGKTANRTRGGPNSMVRRAKIVCKHPLPMQYVNFWDIL
jgi:hypothetical protein